MKTFMKIMGVAALMTGMTTVATAQEQTKETEKPGFFKQAFRDMKESAKAQHKVDGANFAAAKAESRAQWEEAKAIGDPIRRKAVFQAERDKQIRDANERKAAAEARIDAVKGN